MTGKCFPLTGKCFMLINFFNSKQTHESKIGWQDQLSWKLFSGKQSHPRRRYMKVHYHFIREKALQQEIEIGWQDNEQVADLFTKGLSTRKFEYFQHQLNVIKEWQLILRASVRIQHQLGLKI